MEKDTIRISFDNLEVEAVSVILVPDKAIQEPGYIKTLTASMEAQSKHEFHAMAQMAYYRYQDDELDVVEVSNPMRITRGDEAEAIESGMVIYRDGDGEFHVVIHALLNKKKMLEITNRYCTRWVRLDI
ncbi:hypothetical protein [Desulfosediminicola flagellatus]|uniref:hypothetical protein n=1 Tax=Desulfosediminicola flagellatus TaxID=2569541 RepID=UPI0010AC4F52|nr:hypothetical protein [Desulfosediminicola flagellatus]